MDPISDIFRTMHITAFGQHRLEATAPRGLTQEKQAEENLLPSTEGTPHTDLAHFAMLSRGNCWLTVEGIPDPIPLAGGDCFLLVRDTSIIMRDSPQTRPRSTFRELATQATGNVVPYGGGGAPTTIVCGSFSFHRASLRSITQLLPRFILIKADQARTLALHNTMQALASEMAEQAPGSAVVATRLAEVLFIQILRAHIASQPERNQGWLRAVFDPQLSTALNAIHDRVNTAWTVESWPKRRACPAPHSQPASKSCSDKHRWSMSPGGECRRRSSYSNSVTKSSSMLPGWSVTSPTLPSARRSSESSGPTPGNTSNAVLNVAILQERRKHQAAEVPGQ